MKIQTEQLKDFDQDVSAISGIYPSGDFLPKTGGSVVDITLESGILIDGNISIISDSIVLEGSGNIGIGKTPSCALDILAENPIVSIMSEGNSVIGINAKLNVKNLLIQEDLISSENNIILKTGEDSLFEISSTEVNFNKPLIINNLATLFNEEKYLDGIDDEVLIFNFDRDSYCKIDGKILAINESESFIINFDLTNSEEIELEKEISTNCNLSLYLDEDNNFWAKSLSNNRWSIICFGEKFSWGNEVSDEENQDKIFSITYKAVGLTVPVDGNFYAYGESATVKQQVTKVGHVFVGWKSNYDNNIYSPYQNVIVYDNIEFSAVFSLIDNAKIYSVIYNKNGGSGTNPVDNNLYASGDYITGKTKGNLLKTDSIFANWNTEADDTGFLVGQNSAFRPQDLSLSSYIITLYAIWEETDQAKFSIIYSGNGNTSGTEPIDNNTYFSNEDIEILDRGSLLKSGNFFAGWSYADTVVQPQQKIQISQNTTLSAYWVEKEPVTITGYFDSSNFELKTLSTNESGDKIFAISDGSDYAGILKITGINDTGIFYKPAGTGVRYHDVDISYSGDFVSAVGLITGLSTSSPNIFTYSNNGGSTFLTGQNTGILKANFDRIPNLESENEAVIFSPKPIDSGDFLFLVGPCNTGSITENNEGSIYCAPTILKSGISTSSIFEQKVVDNSTGINSYLDNPTNSGVYQSAYGAFSSLGSSFDDKYKFEKWSLNYSPSNLALNEKETRFVSDFSCDKSGVNQIVVGGFNSINISGENTEPINSNKSNWRNFVLESRDSGATWVPSLFLWNWLDDWNNFTVGDDLIKGNTAQGILLSSYKSSHEKDIAAGGAIFNLCDISDDGIHRIAVSKGNGLYVNSSTSSIENGWKIKFVANVKWMKEAGYDTLSYTNPDLSDIIYRIEDAKIASDGSCIWIIVHEIFDSTKQQNLNYSHIWRMKTDSNGKFENTNFEKVIDFRTIAANNNLKYQLNDNSVLTENPIKIADFNGGNSLYVLMESNKIYKLDMGLPTTYSITYDGNSEDSGVEPTDSNNYLNGETATILGNSGVLTKFGKIFSGWNTATDGSGFTYKEGDSLDISKNTILYALWTDPYTITYDGNSEDSGSEPVDSSEYYIGQQATILDKNTLIKAGYQFIGWSESASGGLLILPNSKITITGNLTFYAQWVLEFEFLSYIDAKNSIPHTYDVELEGISIGQKVILTEYNEKDYLLSFNWNFDLEPYYEGENPKDRWRLDLVVYELEENGVPVYLNSTRVLIGSESDSNNESYPIETDYSKIKLIKKPSGDQYIFIFFQGSYGGIGEASVGSVFKCFKLNENLEDLNFEEVDLAMQQKASIFSFDAEYIESINDIELMITRVAGRRQDINVSNWDLIGSDLVSYSANWISYYKLNDIIDREEFNEDYDPKLIDGSSKTIDDLMLISRDYNLDYPSLESISLNNALSLFGFFWAPCLPTPTKNESNFISYKYWAPFIRSLYSKYTNYFNINKCPSAEEVALYKVGKENKILTTNEIFINQDGSFKYITDSNKFINNFYIKGLATPNAQGDTFAWKLYRPELHKYDGDSNSLYERREGHIYRSSVIVRLPQNNSNMVFKERLYGFFANNVTLPNGFDTSYNNPTFNWMRQEIYPRVIQNYDGCLFTRNYDLIVQADMEKFYKSWKNHFKNKIDNSGLISTTGEEGEQREYAEPEEINIWGENPYYIVNDPNYQSQFYPFYENQNMGDFKILEDVIFYTKDVFNSTMTNRGLMSIRTDLWIKGIKKYYERGSDGNIYNKYLESDNIIKLSVPGGIFTNDEYDYSTLYVGANLGLGSPFNGSYGSLYPSENSSFLQSVPLNRLGRSIDVNEKYIAVGSEAFRAERSGINYWNGGILIFRNTASSEDFQFGTTPELGLQESINYENLDFVSGNFNSLFEEDSLKGSYFLNKTKPFLAKFKTNGSSEVNVEFNKVETYIQSSGEKIYYNETLLKEYAADVYTKSNFLNNSSLMFSKEDELKFYIDGVSELQVSETGLINSVGFFNDNGIYSYSFNKNPSSEIFIRNNTSNSLIEHSITGSIGFNGINSISISEDGTIGYCLDKEGRLYKWLGSNENWQINTTYNAGSVAIYNNKEYKCKVNGTVTNDLLKNPEIEVSKWEISPWEIINNLDIEIGSEMKSSNNGELVVVKNKYNCLLSQDYGETFNTIQIVKDQGYEVLNSFCISKNSDEVFFVSDKKVYILDINSNSIKRMGLDFDSGFVIKDVDGRRDDSQNIEFIVSTESKLTGKRKVYYHGNRTIL
jgi:uncharacterized repeat protein (TIGR02543 family)